MSSNAETPRSRSKLTKALVATGVGVALLAGGGGTFAAWSDSATVRPGSIMSGQLKFGALTGGSWRSDSEGPISNIADYRIVPGETLIYSQSVELIAEGAALTYEFGTNVSAPAVTVDSELADVLEQKAVITVGGNEATGPVEMKEGRQVVAVELAITVPFDAVEGTTAQNQKVNLENVTLTATQTAPAVASTTSGSDA